MNASYGSQRIPTNPANKDLDIEDVPDISDIEKLSTRDLKILLIRNCIEIRGIFEKELLREKVRQLWIDYNEKRAQRRERLIRQGKDPNEDSLDDIKLDQLCKICMEREVNCTLLECGHQFTCVTCGRKLVDCPICRQNITRCVRVFKA